MPAERVARRRLPPDQLGQRRRVSQRQGQREVQGLRGSNAPQQARACDKGRRHMARQPRPQGFGLLGLGLLKLSLTRLGRRAGGGRKSRQQGKRGNAAGGSRRSKRANGFSSVCHRK